MNINWFQTYIYEQILFIFPILLRCLQFLTPCSGAVHLHLQTLRKWSYLVWISCDVYICVCVEIFDATQSRHNSSMPIYMYIATKFLSTKLVRLCTILGWLITRCIYATLASKKICSIDTRSLTYTILTTAPFSTFSIHHLKCSS
jgi:hypothetical protein